MFFYLEELTRSGLGGTSLLNANVFLRADEATLGLDYWPPEIRKDPKCLEHCKKTSDRLTRNHDS